VKNAPRTRKKRRASLSGILVQDQSIGKRKEVRVQRYDESTDEEEDYSTSEQVFF
jgi:hypothetical protein